MGRLEAIGLGRINEFMTKMAFRFVLLKRAYASREFEQLLSQTKFRSADKKTDLIGLEISLHRQLTASATVPRTTS